MTASNKVAQSAPKDSAKEGFDIVRLLLEGRAFFALIVIVIVFSLLSPVYFTTANFLVMSSHVAIFGLLAVGMLMVVLTGGIDLSVGSTLGLCGVIAGFLMQGVTINAFGVVLYPPVWVVVVLTCMLGAFAGAVNGVLIAYFKVPLIAVAVMAVIIAVVVAQGDISKMRLEKEIAKKATGNVAIDTSNMTADQLENEAFFS